VSQRTEQSDDETKDDHVSADNNGLTTKALSVFVLSSCRLNANWVNRRRIGVYVQAEMEDGRDTTEDGDNTNSQVDNAAAVESDG
jgi:hypothetical protein